MLFCELHVWSALVSISYRFWIWCDRALRNEMELFLRSIWCERFMVKANIASTRQDGSMTRFPPGWRIWPENIDRAPCALFTLSSTVNIYIMSLVQKPPGAVRAEYGEWFAHSRFCVISLSVASLAGRSDWTGVYRYNIQGFLERITY